MESSSSWIDSSLTLGLNLTPTPQPKLQVKKAEELAEELSRVSNENRKLTEMLTTMCENYNHLQSQFADLMHRTTTYAAAAAVNKRKSPETDQSSSSSDEDSNLFKKPRENSCGGVNGINGGAAVTGIIKRKASNRVLVQTDKSDTSLIVKDGYQWRKYGQKVTRDNPSPRAYFKCSFAPTCQVKKKVQRSADDQTMLVATYDGEHNHLPPSEIELGANRGSNLGPVATNSVCSSTVSPPKPTMMTLDLIQPVEDMKLNRTGSGPVEVQGRPVFQQFIVEQMASSLTKDPGFKAALAAAISGRMMDGSHVVVGKWL